MIEDLSTFAAILFIQNLLQLIRFEKQAMLRSLSKVSTSSLAMRRMLSHARPQVYKLRNGEPAYPTFTAKEMQRRKDAFLEVMHSENLDAMILTSMHNVAYISDFLYCSFGRPYAAILTNDGTLTTVSAGIDGGQPWRRTSAAGGDNIIYSDWQKDNFHAALSEVLPATSSTRRIGCELDHITVLNFRALREHFGAACDFADVSGDTMQVRMCKSAEEVEIIKAGAKVADIGGEAVVEILSSADSPREVDLRKSQPTGLSMRKPNSILIAKFVIRGHGFNLASIQTVRITL